MTLSAQVPNPLEKLGLPNQSAPLSPAFSDAAVIVLISIGIAAIIALCLFLRHRKCHNEIASTRLSNTAMDARNSAASPKRRRRRRKERRNATLAETGGLPPLKDET